MDNPSGASSPLPEQPTVLVVHGNATVREEYRSLLEKKGYRVECAVDGSEGIAAVYRLIPDLVVADILLPEINGYQLCRLLKNDAVMRKIPFILVSAFEEKMDKFWGFKAGADAFMAHDEVRAKLCRQVGMLLDIYERIGVEEKARLQGEAGQELVNIRTRLTQILDKSLVESTLMIEFRGLSDLIHDKSLLNYMLFSLLENILDYDVAAVFYNDKNRDPRHVTFNVAEGRALPVAAMDALKTDFFDRVTQKDRPPQKFDILESDVIGDTSDDVQAVEPVAEAFPSVFFNEFFIDGELIGAFALYAKTDVAFERIFPVDLVLSEIKLLMKLRYLYSQAEILAITDGLTGLFNYRHFINTLDREFRRARRYDLSLSLAIIDIDRFKEFNDTWGHLLGDDVLKKVAYIAHECFRGIDFIARYGGEEIVVIFPETPLENALIACERFRTQVAQTLMPWKDQDLSITVSIGLAGSEASMDGPSDLIRKADEALYRAKCQGRNRTERFPDAVTG